MVTWNCGGLSQELQLEVFAWMQLNPHIGAFILQETHWGFSGDYVHGEWCICHSSTAKGHTGGIMIAVRRQLTDMQQIRWRELVHWRGPIGKQQVDMVAIYQHALRYSAAEVKIELMKKRKSFWDKLDSCVASLPLRSSVFVAGDFNTSLAPFPPVSGFGLVLGSSQDELVQERNFVLQVLQKHRLAILNSWSKKAPAYHHPNGVSQIEFIMARQRLADQLAKESAPITTAVAGWKSAGHRPVFASVKLNWMPWKSKQPDRAGNLSAPPLVGQLSQPVPDLSSLQNAVKTELNIPISRVQAVPRSDASVQVIALWQARRDHFQPATSPLHCIWNVWKRAASRSSLRRETSDLHGSVSVVISSKC